MATPYTWRKAPTFDEYIAQRRTSAPDDWISRNYMGNQVLENDLRTAWQDVASGIDRENKANDPAYQRRASGAYATLYGYDPTPTGSYTGWVGDAHGSNVENAPQYTESKYGANNPVRLDSNFVRYMDETHGTEWDEGLPGVMDQAEMFAGAGAGAWGARFQNQTLKLAEYLNQFDDPQAKQLAASLGSKEAADALAGYATAQTEATKQGQWRTGLQIASVMAPMVLGPVSQGLSSALAPTFGAAAQPLSGAIIGAGVGGLGSAVTGGDALRGAAVGGLAGGLGGVASQQLGPLAGSLTSTLVKSALSPSDSTSLGGAVTQSVQSDIGSQTPLSESVMNVNQSPPTTGRRPMIRLSPGFVRGAY